MPTYKHNDYYGYINNIQEKAISNPEWFWSESDDASQARQWLYNNGASSIVDDIYKNTPDEMKMRIPAKMLSKEIRENRVVDTQRENTNKIAKNVAEVGAAVAGAPALISGFAAAPIATGLGLVGGVVGGVDGSFIGSKIGNNVYTRTTSPDGIGASISTNKQLGSELGGLVGGLAGGTVGAKAGAPMESLMQNKYKWYRPAETFTAAEREAARNEWSGYLDNIQRYKSLYPKYTRKYDGITLKDDPEILLDWTYKPNTVSGLPISKAGRYTSRVNSFIDAAENALSYYKSKGSFIRTYPHPNDLVSQMWMSTRPKTKIVLDDRLTISKSANRAGKAVIGMQPDDSHFYPIEVIGHELGHNHPKFNKFIDLQGLTDNQKNAILNESPYYKHFDYSKLPGRAKSLLKPKEGIDIHDAEYNEGYSDLFGMKTNMYNLGIGKDGKYNIIDLLRYKYLTPYGKHQRFLYQRPGLRRQVQALNESETW